MLPLYFGLSVVLVCLGVIGWLEFYPIALAHQNREGWFIAVEGWQVLVHSWPILFLGTLIGGGVIGFYLQSVIEDTLKTRYKLREDTLKLERDSALSNAQKWLTKHLSKIEGREQRAEVKLQEANRIMRLAQQEIEQKKFEMKRANDEKSKLEQRLKNAMATSKRLRKKIAQA